ncbi:FecR family protein [Chitinophaga alhagiae]|uniref:FecR family protein n=1 Tax=Chitinophaga alhagiae TaxID=2203219 RepID=UPI000E5B33D0|nr:FecR domain-containing protein [Chitinophaga alhagiae]
MTHLTEEQEYLLLGKIGGLLNEAEEKAWEALFEENPAVQKAYDEMIQALPADEVANSFQRIKQNATWVDLAALYKVDTPVPKTRRLVYRSLAAACVILLLSAGGWLFYHYNAGQLAVYTDTKQSGIQLTLANGQHIDLSSEEGVLQTADVQLTNNKKILTYALTDETSGRAGMNRLTVPVGMDYKIALSDGTEVWLNAATRLEFPFAFAGNTREITISGEAYLKVAKNAAKPFLVHLPHSTVRVLGTEFNVNTYDSGVVKVALVEGSVNMQAPTGESMLSPGKEAVYHAGNPIQQQPFDPKLVLSWREGLFYFNGATLAEINKIVPRWFGINTVIDNPNIRSREFVGALDRNQPIQVFLNDLKAISGIDSYIDAEEVLHFK